MKIICSYCTKEIGSGGPSDPDQVSHGMCQECSEYFSRQWHGLPMSEYLDRFHFPVIIVDEDVRLGAVNQAMANLLGREKRALLGLLGGDALECVHARKPGGCGRTVHCKTCAIRISVGHTFNTGETLTRVPATLKSGDDSVRFHITTRKFDNIDAVQVSIDDMIVPE